MVCEFDKLSDTFYHSDILAFPQTSMKKPRSILISNAMFRGCRGKYGSAFKFSFNNLNGENQG